MTEAVIKTSFQGWPYNWDLTLYMWKHHRKAKLRLMRMMQIKTGSCYFCT